MKVTIVTLFPKMLTGFFAESIVKRAIEKKLVEIEIVNLRRFALDAYGAVDDRPYGGGAGMVLRVDILRAALDSITAKEKTVLTSVKGPVFTHKKAVEYAKLKHLVIIAAHYEGVDERVLGAVDEEISMGDFVMTGGEIAAAAIVDAVVRLIPGVLKKGEATQNESFCTVNLDSLIKITGEDNTLANLKAKGNEEITLLEYPQYTRPEDCRGQKVPAVLLSGDRKKIGEWRLKMAFEETKKKRPDLLEMILKK
ncbi:tRNA (guanosine(37)-N1)-methyltransferase TrmD [Candidatus Roizmanbacteria bacterium]|nr:tRNA (guanosine(37)-N1)-methyltransferase TrmD [Candidatus Roizmanbacteria bacterium]